MATTPNFGIPYPTGNDAPDGPDLGEGMASSIDVLLSRARPVANAAARTALAGAALYEGLIVAQSDDFSAWVYLAGAWRSLGSPALGGGGGGGTSLDVAAYSASAVQTLANATDTPIAFGVGSNSTSVTRSTKGVGHKFTCAPGAYLVDTCVRFDSGTAGSRFIGLRKADDSIQYISAQNDGGPNDATRTFAKCVVLSTSTDLYVAGSQSSGSSLATKPTGTPNPSGYVSIALTRLG